MDKLEEFINELEKINKAILYSIDERELEVKRSECVCEIDNQCKMIKSNLHSQDDRD